MKKVVGIGEILWDLLPQGKQPGGAPGNFAYNVMQLGLDGYVVSAIGNDELGDEIDHFFESKKMNRILERVDFPTGTVEVKLDASGVPTYNICENVAWDNIPFNQHMIDLAKETDAICFGTLAMRNTTSYNNINHFIDLVPDNAYKIFDINIRQSYYTEELIKNSLDKCNIFKINEDEVKILMKMFDAESSDEISFCRFLIKEYNLQYLILTKGGECSIVLSHDGEFSEKKTPIVDVVDTVGAGDAFTAAFIVNIMKGESIYKAHEQAVQTSAFVCTRKGAMPSY